MDGVEEVGLPGGCVEGHPSHDGRGGCVVEGRDDAGVEGGVECGFVLGLGCDVGEEAQEVVGDVGRCSVAVIVSTWNSALAWASRLPLCQRKDITAGTVM